MRFINGILVLTVVLAIASRSHCQVGSPEESARWEVNKKQAGEIEELLGDLMDNQKEIAGLAANARDDFKLQRASLLLMTNRLIESEVSHLGDLLNYHHSSFIAGDDKGAEFLLGLRTANGIKSASRTIAMLDLFCPSIKDQATFAAADKLRGHARSAIKLWEQHSDKIAPAIAEAQRLKSVPSNKSE
jgi:hypothetical protein